MSLCDIFDLQPLHSLRLCSKRLLTNPTPCTALLYKTVGFVKRSCASEAEQPVGLLSEAEQAAERSSVSVATPCVCKANSRCCYATSWICKRSCANAGLTKALTLLFRLCSPALVQRSCARTAEQGPTFVKQKANQLFHNTWWLSKEYCEKDNT